jgi:chromosomal replication initiator protein
MNLNLDKKDLMDQIRNQLRPEMNPIFFDTYINQLVIESIDNSNIVFQTDTNYKKDMLENRYASLILNALQNITNRNITFSVHSLESFTPKDENNNIIISSKEKNSENEEIDYSNQSLNPKYTFETFVVGNNNRFAHAAALAVGDNPAKTYNPLFIYGGVGLGKTHLMQAVGNRILQNNRSMNIVYVTSEKFTNHLINSIREGKNDPFRNKYRSADALLIDDIQFIAKKERVQEEFFHTFNTLYENGKQIIISSDKPPRDLPFLEERLKSRFEWGLLADISCPDYETRVAILRKKALDESIIIDDEILADIATKIDSNIRELEGVFNKIVARASLTHSPITIELAENVINEFISKKEKVISSEYIQETVAKYFSIDKKELAGEKRSNDIAFPRQIAMYLCREVANMSFPQIGLDFGKRDHSTVMHAYKKIAKEIKEKTNTKLIVESVKNIILNVEN